MSMTEEQQLAEARRIQDEIIQMANSHPQITFSNYKTVVPQLVRQVGQIALDAARLQEADSITDLAAQKEKEGEK
jgi:hypothetical protein